jgi:hypothetical protein
MPSPQRRRTVFDLSPQELLTLHSLNRSVSATVPPKRPRLSADAGSYSEFELDYGIYERFRDLHARAKAERSDWAHTAHHAQGGGPSRVVRLPALQAGRPFGLGGAAHARGLCRDLPSLASGVGASAPSRPPTQAPGTAPSPTG